MRKRLNELSLFTGAGGGLLASELLGWNTVCACEIEPYARAVLLQRQRDGMLGSFPIWDDIRTFNGNPWRGAVDVISGGFPCQDISAAGKGKGLAGSRSGLVWEMLRVISEVRPSFVFAENSPHLRTNGLGSIVSALSGLGYNCAWGVLGAWHTGGPHRRNRLWLVATDSNLSRQRKLPVNAKACGASSASGIYEGIRGASDAFGDRMEKQPRRDGRKNGARTSDHRYSNPWAEPPNKGMANGLAGGMDRVRATGNGQVPVVAAVAFDILSGVLTGGA